MLLIMNDGQLQTTEQVKQFLEGSRALEFRGLSAEEKYKWTETVLVRFSYLRLKKAEKGVLPTGKDGSIYRRLRGIPGHRYPD